MGDAQLDGVKLVREHQDWYQSKVQPVLQQLAKTGNAAEVGAAVCLQRMTAASMVET
jgi:hypothetical protein